VFDEPVDSIIATATSNYQLDNLIPSGATPSNPLLNEIVIRFASPLEKNKVYQLKVINLSDCAGNIIGMLNTAAVGIPLPPDSLIINEILFNPPSDGYDYAEIYNKGKGPVDLRQVVIAGRDITGTLTDLSQVTSYPFLLFPGEYLVLTENPAWVQLKYTVKNPSLLLRLSQMPSLPDDKGTLVITSRLGIVVDELNYDHKWHFPLIDNEEGISLERISYRLPTGNASNWTSAASTAGFGTPTAQNSQAGNSANANSGVLISPTVFSPDNDGYNDYCFIKYAAPAQGYVANITIFDVAGRPVRYLAVNATLANTGSFRWDGLNDKGGQLSMGNYIIFTEIFNPGGDRKVFRQVVTLARKL
jgi:hypothetical protein